MGTCPADEVVREEGMKKYTIGVVFVGILMLGGCNVFELFSPRMTGASSEEYIYRGNQYFQSQDYDQAVESYYYAMQVNPRSSEARLGYAKSLLWKVIFPVVNVVAEESHKYNDNLYLGLLSALNRKELQDVLLRGKTPVYKTIIDVLEGSGGIVGNQGDAKIKDDNLEVNIVLMVGYVGLIAVNLLDSDRNGVFLTPPDYLILSNDQVVFSLNLDKMISNITASTNVTTVSTGDDLTNVLKQSHDAVEEMLALLRFLYLNVKYVDGLIGCAIRPSTILRKQPATSSAYTNLYDEIRDALTNSHASTDYTNSFALLYVLREAPTNVGRAMNDMHNVLVGSYAYGQLGDFQRSAWGTHSGGLKSYGEALAGVNLTADDVTYVITNRYSPEEISNLIAGMKL